MRGLAALSVVVHHVAVRSPDTVPQIARPLVSHLWLGVTVFFVLSGYLLYRPFAAVTTGDARWPSLSRYVRARALRILPAYWLALSAFLLFEWRVLVIAPLAAVVVGAVAIRRGRTWLGWWLVGVGGLVAFWIVDVARVAYLNDWSSLLRQYLLLQRTGHLVIGPAWTLQIEVAFYVVLPFLAAALARVAARRPRMLALTLLALIAGAVLYQFRVAGIVSLPVALPAYLGLFGVGMLLAVAHEASWLTSASQLALATTSLATIAGASLLRHAGPTIAYQGSGNGPLYQPLMATGFALIIAATLLTVRPTRIGSFIAAAPVEAVGVVSYGIYLWHDPLVLAAQRHGLFTSSLTVNVILIAVVAGGCAAVSWLLVERRLLALKDARGSGGHPGHEVMALATR